MQEGTGEAENDMIGSFWGEYLGQVSYMYHHPKDLFLKTYLLSSDFFLSMDKVFTGLKSCIDSKVRKCDDELSK